MPHIVFNKNQPLTAPAKEDGVKFNFIAKSFHVDNENRKTEYKISVENENKRVLVNFKR